MINKKQIEFIIYPRQVILLTFSFTQHLILGFTFFIHLFLGFKNIFGQK